MQKVYLLLRNNKQQGPYSLEELLQQNLKNFDLVWVEGKSAGWRYPSEIDQLKTFLNREEPPFTQEAKTEAIPELAPTIQKTTVRKQAKVYVSLPVNPAISLPPKEEITPADKLAQKAEALYQRVHAFTASQSEKASEPEAEIKYTRSLDDIKQEYSSWLYEQKSGRKKGKKLSVSYVSAFAFILLTGLLAAYFIYPYNNSDQKNVSETNAENNISTNSEDIIPVNNRTNTNSPGSLTKKKTGQSLNKNIPVAKKVAGKNLPVKKRVLKNTVPLPQLVKLRGQHPANTGNGVPDFKLILQNNSNSHIELATAEVLYYSTSGKLLSRKTVYFSNIAPKASVIRYVSGNNRAGEVHYQLGKMSNARPANFYASK